MDHSEIPPIQSASADYIKLDSFLKWAGAADTGGHAKTMILEEQVRVNGEVEVRRGRKLRNGDRVELANRSWTVDLANRPK